MNPGESRNQRIRLTEMAKIGIGVPSTRCKVNLMESTGAIKPKSTMNDILKIRGRENSTKRAGTKEQGMVKNQL